MAKSLSDLAIEDAVGYERFKSSQVKALMPILNKLRLSVNSILANLDTSNISDVRSRVTRINKLIDATFKKIEGLSNKEYKELVVHVLQQEEEPIAISQEQEEEEFTEEEENSILPIVLSSLVLGKTFSKSLKDLNVSIKNDVAAKIRAGVADNEDTKTIRQRVVGTASRRFNDGAIAAAARHIDSIIRTTTQTYINKAKELAWKARGIEKYRWISVLDSSTTVICRGRSNKVYIVGKGPLPPAHYRCRSSVVIYIKGDEVPQSYSQWLRKQPKDTIEDILGVTKAKMFLNNEVRLDQFTNTAGRELTIKQLRAKARRNK